MKRKHRNDMAGPATVAIAHRQRHMDGSVEVPSPATTVVRNTVVLTTSTVALSRVRTIAKTPVDIRATADARNIRPMVSQTPDVTVTTVQARTVVRNLLGMAIVDMAPNTSALVETTTMTNDRIMVAAMSRAHTGRKSEESIIQAGATMIMVDRATATAAQVAMVEATDTKPSQAIADRKRHRMVDRTETIIEVVGLAGQEGMSILQVATDSHAAMNTVQATDDAEMIAKKCPVVSVAMTTTIEVAPMVDDVEATTMSMANDKEGMVTRG